MNTKLAGSLMLIMALTMPISANACSTPTPQSGCGASKLTVSKRLWDPADSDTASFSLANMHCQTVLILKKNAPAATNSSANAEINGACGMTVSTVTYQTQAGTGLPGWDIKTSDGVDHVIIPGNAEGQSGLGTVTNLADGWIKRTFTAANFIPPITATETIAANNGNDIGYNSTEDQGNVSAVELVYNAGTSDGAGQSILRRIRINNVPVHLHNNQSSDDD